MKATVIGRFRDKDTWHVYESGDEYEGPDVRISELVEAGLVSAFADVQAEETAGLTVAQLKALCDERGIAYPKKATKSQILSLLEG